MATNFERPHKALERKKGVFFRIGLTISLLLTFIAFEWETAIPRFEIPDTHDPWDQIEIENVPRTIQDNEIRKPTPKEISKQLAPQPNPDVLVIVPDENLLPSIIDSLPSEIIPIEPRREIDSVAEDFVRLPEVKPEFPGGEKGMLRFINKNIKYPPIAVKEQINGTVYMTFIIDETGNVVELKCERSPSELLTDEASRVLQKMPKWKPGMQGGKKVRVIMTLPFTFRLLDN